MRSGSCGSECYSARVPGVPVDSYVFDVLMGDLIGHDRQPSAFVLYLFVWRLTDGGKKKSAPISLRTLSERTGLSKRAIQDAADRLERRQLISIERQMPTAVPVYRLHKPWQR
jgi:Helix-turn-helix domain